VEIPFCDVIGCGSQAAWQLQPLREMDPEVPLLEEFLCDAHHKELARLHPELACCYTPLAQNT